MLSVMTVRVRGSDCTMHEAITSCMKLHRKIPSSQIYDVQKMKLIQDDEIQDHETQDCETWILTQHEL